MKENIRIWIQRRKSIVEPLVKSSSIGPALNGKLIQILYRFSREATGHEKKCIFLYIQEFPQDFMPIIHNLFR